MNVAFSALSDKKKSSIYSSDLSPLCRMQSVSAFSGGHAIYSKSIVWVARHRRTMVLSQVGIFCAAPINFEERVMKAIWNGTVIAESQDTVIVEGNHYFSLASVDATLLEPSTHTSVCPWKGTANYYSLKVNGERNENAVWYYAEPKDAARQIRGRVAFWKGVSVVAS
jgi:uncharacterized protein (DUF427 family)